MSNNKRESLPATYLVILSIVARGEKYGYQINQMIENHGIRNWVDIQFSSIYKSLKKLEEMKLISSRKENEDQQTSKRIYSITSKGSEIFTQNILLNLSNPSRPKSMLDIGIYSMWYLTKEQVVDSLEKNLLFIEKRISFLESQIDILENLSEYKEKEPEKNIGGQKVSEFTDESYLPIVQALFERPLNVHKAEKLWLEKFLTKIRNDKNFPVKRVNRNE